MKTPLTILAVAALASAIVGAIAPVNQDKLSSSAFAAAPAGAPQSRKLPKLLDLGANKCIPCKKMAPILEELKKEYAGVFTVEFIDVWQNPSVADKYGIQSIPTQIFFDANGKELFRHEDFYSKEDILRKWKQLGVDVTKRDK